ncbi:6-phosphogluconolactonase [Allohahella marinimesophila]|uniref:6-phosphogluconolactonase n=1 Tax=Allohahella marinimesophila TaxID=1054972 RepID=A0ABP7PDW0_9GAMM
MTQRIETLANGKIEVPETTNFREFPDAQGLAAALAAKVAKVLNAAIQANGSATLAVSGGSTPIPFFEALSQTPLQWDKVQVLLVDERFVATSDDASNTRLVKRSLLKNLARQAKLIEVAVDAPDAEAAAEATNSRYATLHWPLDCCVLGMGNDGHTASLFPGSPQLASACSDTTTRYCCMAEPTGAPHARITLTLPRIRAATALILHIAGDAKLDTLRKALEDMAQPELMPVRYVLNRPLSIFWNP